MRKMKPEDVPRELDAIADIVLAYKPKPKTKPGKKRKRRAAKLAKLMKQSAELRQQK